MLHLGRRRLLLRNSSRLVVAESGLTLRAPIVGHGAALLSGWLQAAVLLATVVALRLTGRALIVVIISRLAIRV